MQRSVLKMSVLAPLAVALTATMTAAPAHADAGPAAYLVKDAVEHTVPAQVADLSHPTVEMPGAVVRGVLKSGRGLAEVDESGAVSRLGAGVLSTGRGDLPFHSIGARCTNDGGTLRGSTTITGDDLLGGLLSQLPNRPPANYRLPAPRGAEIKEIILNKQVRRTAKELTVAAVSLVDETGAARDYGVARCTARDRAADRAADRDGVAAPAAGVTERVVPTVNDLLAAQLGQLPGTKDLKDAAYPRPSRRATEPRSTPAPEKTGGALGRDLAGSAIGLTRSITGLAGTAGGQAESAASVLGGLDGLPLTG